MNSTSHLINRDEFCIKRTPAELLKYVEKISQLIKSDLKMQKDSRLLIEPYKTFMEELRPFSVFCEKRLDNEENVLCYLTKQNEDHDAIILKKNKCITVEITWPIDGKEEHKEAILLNSRGYGKTKVWNYSDTSFQNKLIEIIKKTSRKKARIDYSNKQGSILLIVIDEWLFDQFNPIHNRIFKKLKESLAQYSFQVQEVNLLFMQSKEIIRIQGELAV